MTFVSERAVSVVATVTARVVVAGWEEETVGVVYCTLTLVDA